MLKERKTTEHIDEEEFAKALSMFRSIPPGEMDREKTEWLDSIGAKEFPEPIKYIYSFPGYSGSFNLSERYIKDTSLEELKKQYEKNAAFVMEVLKEKKSQGNFR